MSAQRLDFKHIRAAADFATVLASYDIALQKDGTQPGQHRALCPFHDDSKPSLKVNTDRNIFHCFACDARGNILDFVMEMDGVEIREAAKKVAGLCGLSDTAPAPGRKARRDAGKPAPPPAAPETPVETAADDPPAPNTPLTFTLKLELPTEAAEWLAGRGIDAAVIDRFGLGVASKKSKSIAGRLAIPIHDQTGQLVAYCGRYIGDDLPDDDTPKYVLPKGFRKDIEVFNLHRYLEAPPERPYAVLVRELLLGLPPRRAHSGAVGDGAVDLKTQIERLQEAGIARVLIVFDGDEPGRVGARAVAGQLAPHVWTRVIDLPDGVKPHHLSWDELRPICSRVAGHPPAPLIFPDAVFRVRFCIEDASRRAAFLAARKAWSLTTRRSPRVVGAPRPLALFATDEEAKKPHGEACARPRAIG